MNLDLSCVHAHLHRQARQAFNKGDAGRLLCSMPSSACLAFVICNVAALKQRGIFEAALVQAWTASNVNNAWLDPFNAYLLFHDGDRAKIRAAGDPIPPGDTFTLYRGVAGNGVRRRINGLSWTDDLDCACWFAVRYPRLKHPAVFTATVAADDVLFYAAGRDEREFVTGAARPIRLRLPLDEIKRRSERCTQERQARERAEIAALVAKHKAA